MSKQRDWQMWQKISKKIRELGNIRINGGYYSGEEIYNRFCSEVEEIEYRNNILYLKCPSRSDVYLAEQCIKKSGYDGKIEWSYPTNLRTTAEAVEIYNKSKEKYEKEEETKPVQPSLQKIGTWQEISKKIKEIRGEEKYNTHCNLVKEIEYRDDILCLECPNEPYGDIVRKYIKKSGYDDGSIKWSYVPIQITNTYQKDSATNTKAINKTNVSPKQKRRFFEKTPKFKSKNELDNYIEKTKEDVKELDTKNASKQQPYNFKTKVTSENMNILTNYMHNIADERIDRLFSESNNAEIINCLEQLVSNQSNKLKRYKQQIDYIDNKYNNGDTKTIDNDDKISDKQYKEINSKIMKVIITSVFERTEKSLQRLNSIYNNIPPKPNQTTTMENKYGLKSNSTANWITLNSAMWAYPNDKRKSATVPIHIDCANGSKVCYTLHRGKVIPKDEGYGQLTTTHCRIINTVINLWQQQGCKVSSSCAIIECTIADIIHLLNIKYNGTSYKRIQKHISELAALPMCMANEDDVALSYSLLYGIKEKTNGKYELLIHPFITKQLVGRKAIIRDSNISKINNPIAIKLLPLLDNRLAAGHKITTPLDELSKELELSEDMRNNIRHIKRAITNFKDIKVRNRAINMELSKDNRNKWQLIAKLEPLKFEPLKSLSLLLKTKRT